MHATEKVKAGLGMLIHVMFTNSTSGVYKYVNLKDL